jgi:hypothetical protein
MVDTATQLSKRLQLQFTQLQFTTVSVFTVTHLDLFYVLVVFE